MKYCVACLTRGYTDVSGYSLLIKRNQHIAANLLDKSIDILIFHEGNITIEQQLFIQQHTPDLSLKFICILDKAFRPEKSTIPIECAHRFGLGYRHMCSFWFVDFWHYVLQYDALIRIDEDCFIEFSIDAIFTKLRDTAITTGRSSWDADFVTIGMNEFTLNFMKARGNSPSPKQPEGPYTNVLGLALNILRKNILFMEYIKHIDSSEMIYRRRWGDLPLWGEAIEYILGRKSLYIDTAIKYFHGSHKTQVN